MSVILMAEVNVKSDGMLKTEIRLKSQTHILCCCTWNTHNWGLVFYYVARLSGVAGGNFGQEGD